jgi:hypothetical protein
MTDINKLLDARQFKFKHAACPEWCKREASALIAALRRAMECVNGCRCAPNCERDVAAILRGEKQ